MSYVISEYEMKNLHKLTELVEERLYNKINTNKIVTKIIHKGSEKFIT